MDGEGLFLHSLLLSMIFATRGPNVHVNEPRFKLVFLWSVLEPKDAAGSSPDLCDYKASEEVVMGKNL